jgi:hypothetical protein
MSCAEQHMPKVRCLSVDANLRCELVSAHDADGVAHWAHVESTDAKQTKQLRFWGGMLDQPLKYLPERRHWVEI